MSRELTWVEAASAVSLRSYSVGGNTLLRMLYMFTYLLLIVSGNGICVLHRSTNSSSVTHTIVKMYKFKIQRFKITRGYLLDMKCAYVHVLLESCRLLV